MSRRIPPGEEPLTARPKVGQHVLVRRWRGPGRMFVGPEFYWETGRVEIVRKKEVVVRSRRSYELTVAFGDLFHVPRHWGNR